MAEDTGSSVPRRHLGRVLRQLRTEAGMTVDGAAEALQVSRQRLWRIEAGRSAVSRRDVRDMCQRYAARPELTAALVALAGETRAKGWWHAYGDPLPRWCEPYVSLAAEARRLREYADGMIPALLQTRGYAMAVCRRRSDLTEAEREKLIEVRLRRQDVLRRRLPAAPRVEAMLAEAVLLRAVSDPAVMVEQLRHLVAVSRLPQVSLRVVPLAVGVHRAAIAGPFMLLDFPPGNRAEPDPPVVYRELLTGSLYLDREPEVAAYEQVWAGLDAVALDHDQSRHLIEKITAQVHHADA
ncbi:helix-turn-helix domain-containing protein [Micromonospora endophytica]|uniref:Transcriptional regulator n=1 Tax=Micromonospora endophytica TaxID=515350 RepID=A0A2W2CI93_9ACTN|nr:helix-turn-helix transcriptional regulator [Micromonospora endophytica]PZF98302.1 transcriptional regulator [Micromonospora endophytica]RIW42787.1 XRE family transcriptional regulator [Micromonospora endophytica]BCJ62774.1 transcriptional regulator [Micromonospora endophytica]